MSRYSSYDDVYAVCPYYVGGSKQEVRCEGFYRGWALIIRFGTDQARQAWRQARCDLLPGYDRCPFFDAHETEQP